MNNGRNIQLTKQVGEYLVACELSRRGFLSSTFSGNIPEFDIVAVKLNGSHKLIQVKTINGGSWQFSIDRFVSIKMDGSKQIIGERIAQPIDHLICVLVHLGSKYGEDKFFVLKWNKLQDILIQNHQDYLNKHDGERPRSKESMHCGLLSNDIEEYENKWDIIES